MTMPKPLYFKIGLILLLVGVAGILLPFISFGVSDDYATLEVIAQNEEAQNSQNKFLQQVSISLATPTPVPSVKFDPNHLNVTDRLVISKIGVDMPLFESDKLSILWKGGWVFPGTSTPDKGGNTVIFGHRFRYLPPINNTFFSLDKIQMDDTFTVVWKGTIYHYQVIDKKVIEPSDFSILSQSSEQEVTLVTCTPLWTSKQRLVVVGKLLPN